MPQLIDRLRLHKFGSCLRVHASINGVRPYLGELGSTINSNFGFIEGYDIENDLVLFRIWVCYTSLGDYCLLDTQYNLTVPLFCN